MRTPPRDLQVIKKEIIQMLQDQGLADDKYQRFLNMIEDPQGTSRVDHGNSDSILASIKRHCDADSPVYVVTHWGIIKTLCNQHAKNLQCLELPRVF